MWGNCLVCGKPLVGEGNGTPLQYSCLENPMDGRSLVGCSPWGREESDTTERLHFHFSLSCIGEGNGNPLRYSCLENPRDGGTWWAAVYGVTESDTTEATQQQQQTTGGLVVKNPPATAWDTGLIPGPERFHMLQSN